MTTTTKFHPELEATLLDILAGADKPWTSTELSIKATTSLRRFVQRSETVVESDVMTWNPNHNYWEVTGATVSNTLRNRDDVIESMNGTGSRKTFALKANVERWEAEKQAKVEKTAKAQKRYVIETLPGMVRVVDKDRSFVGRTFAVAIFDTTTLPEPEAQSLALKVQMVLVREMVL